MCPNEDKVKYVDEGTVDDGDDGEAFYNIRCVKGKPMTERVMISGLALEFEIDSGSAVSVISDSTYKSYLYDYHCQPPIESYLVIRGNILKRWESCYCLYRIIIVCRY